MGRESGQRVESRGPRPAAGWKVCGGEGVNRHAHGRNGRPRHSTVSAARGSCSLAGAAAFFVQCCAAVTPKGPAAPGRLVPRYEARRTEDKCIPLCISVRPEGRRCMPRSNGTNPANLQHLFPPTAHFCNESCKNTAFHTINVKYEPKSTKLLYICSIPFSNKRHRRKYCTFAGMRSSFWRSLSKTKLFVHIIFTLLYSESDNFH